MWREDTLVAIEALVEDYNFVKERILLDEVSVAQNLQRHLTKMLILLCASYYENTICDAIKIYSQKHSKEYDDLPHGFEYMGSYSFFRMFDFGRDKLHNAKAFLKPVSFMGRIFREKLVNEISSDENKEANLQAFQEICSMRNSLAHNDLIVYDDASAKSFEDIKTLHDRAIRFIDLFKQKLL